MIRFLFSGALLIFLQMSCYSFADDNTVKTLAAKTFVVTCATGELGTAIAEELASENNLILMGRDQTKLTELQERLSKQFHYTYSKAPLDYENNEALKTSFHDLKKNGIHGLVLLTPRPNFGSDLLQNEAEWNALFQTTFIGPVELLKNAIPLLDKGGKIAIIAGTTSVQLQPEYGPACMVRRMWSTYAKALSHKLGPQGIYVNVLSPGIVLTKFHEARIAKKAKEAGTSYQAQLEKETANIPLRRFVAPIEVARSVKFLLSEHANAIDGVNLVIDGGGTVSY